MQQRPRYPDFLTLVSLKNASSYISHDTINIICNIHAQDNYKQPRVLAQF